MIDIRGQGFEKGVRVHVDDLEIQEADTDVHPDGRMIAVRLPAELPSGSHMVSVEWPNHLRLCAPRNFVSMTSCHPNEVCFEQRQNTNNGASPVSAKTDLNKLVFDWIGKLKSPRSIYAFGFASEEGDVNQSDTAAQGRARFLAGKIQDEYNAMRVHTMWVQNSALPARLPEEKNDPNIALNRRAFAVAGSENGPPCAPIHFKVGPDGSPADADAAQRLTWGIECFLREHVVELVAIVPMVLPTLTWSDFARGAGQNKKGDELRRRITEEWDRLRGPRLGPIVHIAHATLTTYNTFAENIGIAQGACGPKKGDESSAIGCAPTWPKLYTKKGPSGATAAFEKAVLFPIFWTDSPWKETETCPSEEPIPASRPSAGATSPGAVNEGEPSPPPPADGAEAALAPLPERPYERDVDTNRPDQGDLIGRAAFIEINAGYVNTRGRDYLGGGIDIGGIFFNTSTFDVGLGVELHVVGQPGRATTSTDPAVEFLFGPAARASVPLSTWLRLSFAASGGTVLPSFAQSYGTLGLGASLKVANAIEFGALGSFGVTFVPNPMARASVVMGPILWFPK